MKVIYKYRLGITDGPQRIHLPKGAFVVMVDSQQDQLYFWAEFDRNEKRTEARDFFVHGTGHDIPDDQVWVGSAQMQPFAQLSPLVWHVYEGIR